MTKKEQDRKLKLIERALNEFPKVVKQNALRGKNHRKLMKAFAPVAKEVLRQVKRNRKVSGRGA